MVFHLLPKDTKTGKKHEYDGGTSARRSAALFPIVAAKKVIPAWGEDINA
jgi:hypothetical protein